MFQCRKGNDMKYVITDDKIVYKDEEGNVLAQQDFPAVDDMTVDIRHTEVDGSLQGQGIAGKMTELAVIYLKNQGKKIIPSCSYVESWFEGKPEYRGLLK